jgi:hypothetical protein
MCAFVSCSADGTVTDVNEHQTDVPMQFSQAAMNTPVTRAATTSSPLTEGFMVSCWKGINSAKPQEVMGNYEVKYKYDGWNNSSKWEYVGTTANGYYKDQQQRYWDAEAFPYRFYAITPCPAHSDIANFELNNTCLKMPLSVEYAYQTCNNGAVAEGAEPYKLAHVEYNKVSSYVALPFYHLTSKVRFLIYNNYKKEIPAIFELYNVKIKAVGDDFVKVGKGYTADLTSSDMMHGTFAEAVKTSGDEAILVQTDDANKCNLRVAADREHAYDCLNPTGTIINDGLLMVPQKNVKLSFSFDVYGMDFELDFASDDGKVTYEKATKTIHYKDVVIDGTYNWEPNTIYTYIIKVNEFYPLTIDLSAELTPWTDVVGSIDTNLEK